MKINQVLTEGNYRQLKYTEVFIMKYEINNAHTTLLDELQTMERRTIRTNAEAIEETYYEYNGQADDVTDFYGNTYDYYSLKGVLVG